MIGTDITGTKKIGNAKNGIYITTGSNTIGGSLDSEKNIISGNGENGILIAEGAADNVVTGNFIGSDTSGRHHLGNGENGIQIGLTGYSGESSSNTIGGLNGEGNLIGANKGNGILILAQSQGNLIQGNSIGIGKNKAKLPNRGDGVKIVNASLNTVGGGNASDFGNVIAYNLGYGVTIGKNRSDDVADNNLILNNSIYKNKRGGIDLHGRKGQSGPNHSQRPPKISKAVSTADQLEIKGELKGMAGNHYLLQFFSSPLSHDPQGKKLLGNYLVSPDASGKALFSYTVAQSESQAYITATSSQVDSSGNPRETSEFSHPQKTDRQH